MKKQFLVFAVTFITVAFISCSKDGNELPQQQESQTEEQVAAKTATSERTINPLLVRLEGWYTFNGHLKDATGKLAPGVPIGQMVKYTTDRKGFLNSALRMDGTYFVKLFNIPQQTTTSISVWVKTSDFNQNKGIVSDNAQGPFIVQKPNKFMGGLILAPPGGISVSTALQKDIPNMAWHHLVVSYDGNTVRYYLDAVLVGTSNLAGSMNVLVNYIVGSGYWKGDIDDLRFYSRTLSAADVQNLFNL